MARIWTTRNHLKRTELDRRLGAGEPAAQLGSANAIRKEAARGSAALLPLRGNKAGKNRPPWITAEAGPKGGVKPAIGTAFRIKRDRRNIAKGPILRANHAVVAHKFFNIRFPNMVN